MTDGNVISLADHRAKRAEGVERALVQAYSMKVERYAGQDAQEFRIAGLGSDIAAMDVERISRDMVDSVLCLAADYHRAGGTGRRVVAAVMFYDDGMVSSTVDSVPFADAGLRTWLLEDQLPYARASLLDNFSRLP